MKSPLSSSPADETIIPAAKLPAKLNCLNCGLSIYKVGGYVVTLAKIIGPKMRCTALCDPCGNGEAS